MPKIAFFTAFNCGIPEVESFQKEILPDILAEFDVDLFTTDLSIPLPPELEDRANVYSYRDFVPISSFKEYDLLLYQLAGCPEFELVYDSCLQFPGLILLESFNLSEMLVRKWLSLKEKEKFRGEMEKCSGLKGKLVADDILAGRFDSYRTNLIKYPLLERVINLSLGIIVRNRFVFNFIRRKREDIPLFLIPHRVNVLERSQRSQEEPDTLVGDPSRIAEVLKGEKDFVVFVHGHTQEPGSAGSMIGAFERLLDFFPQSALIIQPSELSKVEKAFEKNKHKENIFMLPGMDPFTIPGLVNRLDLIVDINLPYCGEVSLLTLKLMAQGKPTLFFDRGAYREIPQHCAIKINPELDFRSRINYFLQLFAHNRRLAKAVGQAGARYVEQQFSGQGGSDAYLSLLRDYFSSRQMWKEVGQESREVIGEKVREQARAGPKRDAIQVDPELSDFAISLYRELKFLGFAGDDSLAEDILEAAAEVAL
ncbi:hypothetical protein HKBW3S42_00083 [Candidatus Hakubella thermalkaliphila]|uniref:Glycosyl transferase family 1 domain-containing protein n=1 Tax=Candidatus Hakubella thermalkaliphila TaxID=2754717 RepID=A0A6V8PLB2_9ACTN|nr:hypothetical protein HKBW3S42_00083 [Candidatus Hakubella thermalkaliphila]